MAESAHLQTFCLVYDTQQDKAAWVHPSTASTLEKVNPCIEQIEENHPHYAAYCKLAGPKPEIPIKEHDGGRWGETTGSNGTS